MTSGELPPFTVHADPMPRTPSFRPWQIHRGRFDLAISRRSGIWFRTPWFTLEVEPRKREPLCPECGWDRAAFWPDVCLGKLPGVSAACCGHGDRARSHIVFASGVVVRGFWIDEKWSGDVAEMNAIREAALVEPDRVAVTIECQTGSRAPLTDEDALQFGRFVDELVREEAGIA